MFTLPSAYSFSGKGSDTKKGHLSFSLITQFLFQPPAFAKETPESIKAYIEVTYLSPRLDPEEFSPEKSGRQWDFDWFEEAKVHPEPSIPRSVVVPRWELPFRRKKKGSMQEKWEPNSVEV